MTFPRLIVLALVVILSGCSAQQTINYSSDRALLESHISKLASIDSWNIRGRLSIRTADGGQIGRLVWKRRGEVHQFDLYGSLGSGHVRISVEPGEVVLADSEGEMLTGSTAREVLDQYLGWQFPVEELGYWVIGTAFPGSFGAQKWDTLGHVVWIEQSGWQVSLSKYADVDHYQLPTRFRLVSTETIEQSPTNNNNEQAQPHQIRLIVTSWTLD